MLTRDAGTLINPNDGSSATMTTRVLKAGTPRTDPKVSLLVFLPGLPNGLTNHPSDGGAIQLGGILLVGLCEGYHGTPRP